MCKKNVSKYKIISFFLSKGKLKDFLYRDIHFFILGNNDIYHEINQISIFINFNTVAYERYVESSAGC